jgi:hypothetical protein
LWFHGPLLLLSPFQQHIDIAANLNLGLENIHAIHFVQNVNRPDSGLHISSVIFGNFTEHQSAFIQPDNLLSDSVICQLFYALQNVNIS